MSLTPYVLDRAGPGYDVVYAHHADERLTTRCLGPCIASAGALAGLSERQWLEIDSTRMERDISRAVCMPSKRCESVGPSKQLAPGLLSERADDFFFLSELRLAVMHTIGFINWVWY